MFDLADMIIGSPSSSSTNHDVVWRDLNSTTIATAISRKVELAPTIQTTRCPSSPTHQYMAQQDLNSTFGSMSCFQEEQELKTAINIVSKHLEKKSNLQHIGHLGVIILQSLKHIQNDGKDPKLQILRLEY